MLRFSASAASPCAATILSRTWHRWARRQIAANSVSSDDLVGTISESFTASRLARTSMAPASTHRPARLLCSEVRLRLFYVCFMDDILILAPTRWQFARCGEGRQPDAGNAQAREAPGQDLHRQYRARLRLPWLPFQPGRIDGGCKDDCQLYREGVSAL